MTTVATRRVPARGDLVPDPDAHLLARVWASQFFGRRRACSSPRRDNLRRQRVADPRHDDNRRSDQIRPHLRGGVVGRQSEGRDWAWRT